LDSGGPPFAVCRPFRLRVDIGEYGGHGTTLLSGGEGKWATGLIP
jgi:hypothetical protein